MNSLGTNVLSKRYLAHLSVFERGGKSGQVHFHLLAVCRDDIRTGVDFEAFGRGDYRTAGPALRAEWAFWRDLTNYNGRRGHLAAYPEIGRTEFLPVRSTEAGIRKYVGKYIEKHLEHRTAADKGVRLLRMSRGLSHMTVKFSWVSPRATMWRLKLAAFCAERGYASTAALKQIFGRRWAYLLRDVICAHPLPSVEMFKPRTFAIEDGKAETSLAFVVHGAGLGITQVEAGRGRVVDLAADDLGRLVAVDRLVVGGWGLKQPPDRPETEVPAVDIARVGPWGRGVDPRLSLGRSSPSHTPPPQKIPGDVRPGGTESHAVAVKLGRCLAFVSGTAS